MNEIAVLIKVPTECTISAVLRHTFDFLQYVSILFDCRKMSIRVEKCSMSESTEYSMK